ncbi:Fc.00g079730.m01.CDS01 [Cosmosporella sp. VM-42]
MAGLPHMQFDHLPAAPYTRRAPSPPVLHIPAHHSGDASIAPKLKPSYEHIDASLLSVHDAHIITGDAKHQATNNYTDWTFAQRREAQRILDFLYLGPISSIRDHGFLQREGITMLLVAQNCRMGSQRLMTVDKAAETLNIEAQYININSPDHLVNSFPDVIRTINNHLLARHHAKASDPTIPPGRVLVTCETGNNRSATIVAAYIMAVFGQEWIPACQFISVQRFSVGFDDDMKTKLLTWQEILKARSQVAAAPTASPMPASPSVGNGSHAGKRRTEDTDDERFAGRDTFVPFVDEV